jgi:NAD(P)H-dependent flavin oxidoreductase YrpB (nitropropane dioxygenase family)
MASAKVPQLEQLISTEITSLFNIRHPVVLAGMNLSGAELAAAVSNAGGLGVIGGVGYSPKMLRREIAELKTLLRDPSLPFGVDLLIPQVGGSARKTNTDYTGGQLPELIDIIIEEGAKLFVCAVGIPPKFAVDKLHKHGIPVMNMCGHPKHALKALDSGADLLCVQGGEGGGHTGEISTMVLIPQVVDLVQGRKSPLTGKQVSVLAAGGIFDGRGLAAALSLGAQGVWVGTRFVASFESKAPPRHVDAIIKHSSDQTIRTTIYTGRPMRVLKDKYNAEWEELRRNEMLDLQSKGVIPVMNEDAIVNNPEYRPLLLGQAIGGVHEQLPAAEIVNRMVTDAVRIMKTSASYLGSTKSSTTQASAGHAAKL